MGRKHSKMIDFLMKHPDKIEKGVNLIYKEFWIGEGRADIIGTDNGGNLVIVEVKTKKMNRYRANKRLRKYYVQLKRLFGIMGIKKKIRVFLYDPTGVKFLANITPYQIIPKIGARNGLPNVGELYGNKIDTDNPFGGEKENGA